MKTPLSFLATIAVLVSLFASQSQAAEMSALCAHKAGGAGISFAHLDCDHGIHANVYGVGLTLFGSATGPGALYGIDCTYPDDADFAGRYMGGKFQVDAYVGWNVAVFGLRPSHRCRISGIQAGAGVDLSLALLSVWHE